MPFGAFQFVEKNLAREKNIQLINTRAPDCEVGIEIIQAGSKAIGSPVFCGRWRSKTIRGPDDLAIDPTTQR